MKNILLITDNIDIKLEDTIFFIKSFEKRNIKVEIFNIDVHTFPYSKKIETINGIKEIKNFDLIVNRLDLYSSEIRALHTRIKFYNNKILNDDFEITNNKFLSTELLKINNIKVIETFNINKYNVDNIIKKLNLPMVIKGTEGYSGNQVFKVNSKKEILKILKENNNLFFIAQPYIECNNTDFRVINILGKTLFQIKRHSETDFRANIQLGGDFEFLKIDKDLEKISKKIMKIFNLDMLGLDFIYDGKNYLFCEANNCYGIRNQEVADKIIEYLLNNFK